MGNPGKDSIEPSAAEDAGIVARVLAGDREAFGALVSKYQGVVRLATRRFAGDRHLADDMAQETFLLAYRSLGQLRRPELFGAWLCRIARNVALGHTRRKSAEGPSLEALSEIRSLPAGGPGAGQGDADSTPEARHEKYLAALRLMEELPEPYRSTLVDRYVNGLSCAEIASRRGVPLGTVTSRLSRGLGLLREAMEKAGFG
ncbi:MAG: sigma-70 family RNA polymerase sigma factor [Planctomycetota bacterium]|nr:sigma-70 family RNA polymerase sigma factor [Planctomycetota bacterium]